MTDVATTTLPGRFGALPLYKGQDCSKSAFWIGLLIICGFGLILRATDMNSQPFWMDEAFSYYAARNSVYAIIFGAIDNHPPLFYLIQHFWQDLSPGQEFMRIPAMTAGVAIIAVAGLMGSNLLGRIEGLAAALIVALSANQTYFSLDTRMYTLMALGAALATWGLAGLTLKPRRLYYGLYIAGATIAICSQFISLLYLLGLNLAGAAIMTVDKNAVRRLAGLLAANIVLLVLVMPGFWLAASAAGSFPGLGVTPLWVVPWFLKNTFGFPGISGPLGTALLLCAGAFFLLGGYSLSRKVPKLAVLLIWAIAFYISAIIVVDQLYIPIFANRILIVTIVPFALVLGSGFAALSSNRLRALVAILFVVVGGYSVIMVREHAPKVEDVPAALAFAKRSGFDQVPIGTCDIFTSSTASLYSGNQPVLWLEEDGTAIRFEPKIVGGLPISEIRGAKGAALLRKFEDAGLAEGGNAELAGADRVVALEAVCDIADRLRNAGFTRLAEKGFQDRPVMMESVWTRVSLWERSAPPEEGTVN